MQNRRRGSQRVGRRSHHVGFERLVERALAGIPSPFRDALAEVAIVIDDLPSRDQLAENELDVDDTLYGLYEGVREPNTAPTGSPHRTGSRSSACRSRRISPIRTTSPTRSGSRSSTSLPT